jgi:hypothetical protein
MEAPEIRGHVRSRTQRVGILRRRAALASALGFAAFAALAAQHAVGSAKHAATTVTTRTPAAAPTRYFDEQPGSYAFDDSSAAAPAPAVAQTRVS